MTQDSSPLTLEEKIDEILRYQKSMQRWARVKTVTNLVFLVIFVALPLVAMVYLFSWAKDSLGLDLSGTREAVEGLRTIGETGNNLNDSVGGLLDTLNQNPEAAERLRELGLEPN